jgi:hypothetical protein
MSASDSIDDYLRSIATLVESLQGESRSAAAAGKKIGKLKVRQAIEGGFGEVTVDIFGGLCSVDLDKAKLTHTTGKALGQRIVQAINAAETRARTLHKRLATRGGSL